MKNFSSIRRNENASRIEQLMIGGKTITKRTVTTKTTTMYGSVRIFFGNPKHGPQVQVLVANKCVGQLDLPRLTGPERALLRKNAESIGIVCEG